MDFIVPRRRAVWEGNEGNSRRNAKAALKTCFQTRQEYELKVADDRAWFLHRTFYSPTCPTDAGYNFLCITSSHPRSFNPELIKGSLAGGFQRTGGWTVYNWTAANKTQQWQAQHRKGRTVSSTVESNREHRQAASPVENSRQQSSWRKGDIPSISALATILSRRHSKTSKSAAVTAPRGAATIKAFKRLLTNSNQT